MPTTVSYLPRFDKQLERLEQKYPKTTDVVLGLIDQIEVDQRPGQLVPRVGYTVYKVRLPNRAARRGKSGGFRIIYYVHSGDRVTLLTIYSKTDDTDISIAEIRTLVLEAEQ
ncbi:MAG: type II toxin-antitoxin system RelE/ParE family toxin [Chloroflexi bacterium]|nr:type II toxin-antitoxin system RelE/ParE family toxin [Chloroflexota bacterium]